jgi:benzodiazapine receptor
MPHRHGVALPHTGRHDHHGAHRAITGTSTAPGELMATLTFDHRATHRHDGIALALLIALCEAAGLIGVAVGDMRSFYGELYKPPWAPAPWLFGPVWTALYALMGTAAWLVWRTPQRPARREALSFFAIQLALNALWIPVFAGLGSLEGGLLVIGALVVAITMTLARFHALSRPAAWLLVPYLAWATFATGLNAAIVKLN